MRRHALAAFAAASEEGELDGLARVAFFGKAGAGYPRRAQRQEVVAGELGQLRGDGLDLLATAGGEQDERQVLGEREQPVGAEPQAAAEPFRPPQQRRRRQLRPLEQLQRRVGQGPVAVAIPLAEVERQGQRLAPHSKPPSQCPRATAARPAASEPPRLSHIARASPSSPSRCDSNIQVEKVV